MRIISKTMKNVRIRKPRSNLIGKRFGKLLVVSWANNSRWNCLCDCGRETQVLTANLATRNTSSCGCVRNIKSSKRATTHGLSKTAAYKTWCSIKSRCFATNSASYKDYGAKGITMWDEWVHDPVSFIEAVGQPPSPNHTLDRIDNTKGYEPGNVRWATVIEQANNKTNNRILVWRGETYTLAQLARKIAAECSITQRDFENALGYQLRLLQHQHEE